MIKSRFFHSFWFFWLRVLLELIVWETVVLALAWFLFQKMYWAHYFADILFLVGIFELIIAAAGMKNTFDVTGRYWHGAALLIAQPSDQQRSEHALAEFMTRAPLAVRLVASGLLTILAAVVLNHYHI